jgi:hypothetical protein
MGWISNLSARLGWRAKPPAHDHAEAWSADPNENPDWVIIPRAPLDEEPDEPPSQAQLRRRQRSAEILRDCGLPFYPWMPDVMDERSVQLRELDEIVDRIAAVGHTSSKARIFLQGIYRKEEQEECDALLHHPVAQVFTDEERRFIADPDPAVPELAQHAWRLEALPILLWAVRLWDEPVGPPYSPVEHEAVTRALQSRDATHSDLRPIGEILDLYDLTARCYWPAQYFHYNGRAQPPAYQRDVLIEHFHALEWLLRTREWDEWMDDGAESDEQNDVDQPDRPASS